MFEFLRRVFGSRQGSAGGDVWSSDMSGAPVSQWDDERRDDEDDDAGLDDGGGDAGGFDGGDSGGGNGGGGGD